MYYRPLGQCKIDKMAHRIYVAKYTTYSNIRVPITHNIFDKSIVEDYSFKYNNLTLFLANGEEVEIEGELEDLDLKYADNLKTMFDTCELVDSNGTEMEMYHKNKLIPLDSKKWFEIRY